MSATCAHCGTQMASGVRFCGECGASATADDRPQARRIGRFVLGPAIGHGGMGVVHRAQDTDLKRDVALKLISPSLAGDRDFRARFEAEARAAAAVDHPNVLPVFEAGEDAGELYLAMRLVEGTDLRAVLARTSPLPPLRAAQIVAQIAAALDAAHARSLVHRDVKPANVLIAAAAGGKDHVYLTDFGLTQTLGGGGHLTIPGQIVGTANYLAPEQIAGDPIDGRVDVYALACVSFELLTGEPPFARETVAATMNAHLRERVPLASSRIATLPREVDEALAGGLAKQPGSRFASCGALAKALGTGLGAGTGSIPRDPQVAVHARPQPAPPAAPAQTATAALEAAPRHGGAGRVLAAALALFAAAALFAAGLLLVPSLRGEGEGRAGLDAALPVLDGAQDVNRSLSSLISRLALDPVDETEREDQSRQLPRLRAEVHRLLTTTRASVTPPIRPLLIGSLLAQERLLDRYDSVLGAAPANAGPLIEEMRATLDQVEAELREAQRVP